MIVVERDDDIDASRASRPGVGARILPKDVDRNGLFDAARRRRYGENKPLAIRTDGGETTRRARQGDGAGRPEQERRLPGVNSGASETGTAMTLPFAAR